MIYFMDKAIVTFGESCEAPKPHESAQTQLQLLQSGKTLLVGRRGVFAGRLGLSRDSGAGTHGHSHRADA